MADEATVTTPESKCPKAWCIVISCVVCLTVLELYALSQGINGTLLASVFALIGGIGGRYVPGVSALKRLLPVIIAFVILGCACPKTAWRSESADGTLDTVTISNVTFWGAKSEQQADASIIVGASGEWEVKLGAAATAEATAPSMPKELWPILLEVLKKAP